MRRFALLALFVVASMGSGCVCPNFNCKFKTPSKSDSKRIPRLEAELRRCQQKKAQLQSQLDVPAAEEELAQLDEPQ